jgi:enamine deaminase RidA (YjgF/YER057c/UK114 family)
VDWRRGGQPPILFGSHSRLESASMSRKLITTGSSFERDAAYSRAVIDGRWVFVSGTTGFDYATMTISEDVVSQADQCFRNIQRVLADSKCRLSDVVRVKYILPDRTDFQRILPVLQRYLGDICPAATMIEAGLLDPRMKIEIEVTARRQKRKKVETDD